MSIIIDRFFLTLFFTQVHFSQEYYGQGGYSIHNKYIYENMKNKLYIENIDSINKNLNLN